MLAPMRPRPIIPSCILVSSLARGFDLLRFTTILVAEVCRGGAIQPPDETATRGGHERYWTPWIGRAAEPTANRVRFGRSRCQHEDRPPVCKGGNRERQPFVRLNRCRRRYHPATKLPQRRGTGKE